jgi:hypothetical protein
MCPSGAAALASQALEKTTDGVCEAVWIVDTDHVPAIDDLELAMGSDIQRHDAQAHGLTFLLDGGGYALPVGFRTPADRPSPIAETWVLPSSGIFNHTIQKIYFVTTIFVTVSLSIL